MGIKRKICVVVTARPSYARIETALRSIRDHKALELQLVVAASAMLDKYGSAIRIIEKDFDVSATAFTLVEGESPMAMAKTTGLSVIELSTIFGNLKPDFVVTIADRYETIATAIAASYMNIPLAHVQGGEVTGNIDEKVRHAITKLSDLHLVSSESARNRLLRMGEAGARIVVTGCPSIDLAREVKGLRGARNFDPYRLYGGVGPKIDLDSDYVIVMQHPVTAEPESARQQVEETMAAVVETGLPALWFWPNPDGGAEQTAKGIRVFRETLGDHSIHFFKNMPPRHFLSVLDKARCIVGNSSVAIRECSFLGVPAVNIGNRQRGRERGANVIDVPHEKGRIVEAMNEAVLRRGASRFPSETLYGDGNAGDRIAEAIAAAEPVFDKMLTY